ncbi:hypothetical protein [Enterobacteriaceae endosymbiont of Plateumaris rustica]|nr:hypothetical protein [Enterobacteriaceae endosymbiont of Plateumaris rustica]
MTLGIGAGQIIDSIKLATIKAKERKFILKRSSIISDVFFPF